MPIPKSDYQIPFSDKVAHLGLYALLSLLWLLVAIKSKSKLTSPFLGVFIVLSVYGIVIEVIQGIFIVSRSFDAWDILANSVGIILGLIAYYFGRKKDWI